MTDTQTGFSDEEKDRLKHEEFISEVLKRRPSGSTKPSWQIFLESSGGVALITLLLGGGFSTYITYLLQRHTAEREFKNQMVRIYSEHRLGSEAGFIKGREENLTSALELVGTVPSHAQSRIDIDGPRFAKRIDPNLEKKNSKQKEEVRIQFNDAIDAWSARKGALEPRIGFYFGEAARVAWGSSALAIDSFLECANFHVPNFEGKDLCVEVKKPAEAAVSDLIDELSSAPRRPWLTQEEVNEIRTLLKPADEADDGC